MPSYRVIPIDYDRMTSPEFPERILESLTEIIKEEINYRMELERMTSSRVLESIDVRKEGRAISLETEIKGKPVPLTPEIRTPEKRTPPGPGQEPFIFSVSADIQNTSEDAIITESVDAALERLDEILDDALFRTTGRAAIPLEQVIRPRASTIPGA